MTEDFWQGLCCSSASLARRYGDVTTYPVKAKALCLSNEVFFMVNDTQMEIMRPYAPSDVVTFCINLVLYVPCIIFVLSLFINQHLCTLLCILNHTLVTHPARFFQCWHRLQGGWSNCKFYATHPSLLTVRHETVVFQTKMHRFEYH